MGSLQVWSIVIILYQTIIAVTISWCTLDCRFAPDSSELQEITLMKLLYLYDPGACGRIHFYNVTVMDNYNYHSTVIWPLRNTIAADFRSKIRLWLCSHVVWLLLSVANLTHGARSCGFYAVLLPFAITGLAILIIDLIYMGLFLKDIQMTNDEMAILLYISEHSSIGWINKPFPWASLRQHEEDTSWISLLFAFISCRGVVQWFINFWLVKDNYFDGLAAYHRLQKERSRRISKV